MRRLFLVALALLVLWWTGGPSSALPFEGVVSMSAAVERAPDADSSGAGDSAPRWSAAQQALAAPGGTLCQSAPPAVPTLPHANPGGRGGAFTSGAPIVSVRSAPRYLRHTPLLI